MGNLQDESEYVAIPESTEVIENNSNIIKKTQELT
jgi:hypothetical protein